MKVCLACLGEIIDNLYCEKEFDYYHKDCFYNIQINKLKCDINQDISFVSLTSKNYLSQVFNLKNDIQKIIDIINNKIK